MEFFPIAALIIATFLLLIGIVGRGASMGSSQFHITLEGSIGRLPRVAILTASIVTYILAIFLFVYAAESKSSSGSGPAPAQSVQVTPLEDSSVEISVASYLTTSDSGVEITEERDSITIGDSEPVLLYMDSNNPEANGVFYLDPSLSGTEVDYSIEIVCIYEDGTEETYSGEGVLTVKDGGEYEISIYDDGSAEIE